MKRLLYIILSLVNILISIDEIYGQNWSKEIPDEEVRACSICQDYWRNIITLSYTANGTEDTFYFAKFDRNGNLISQKPIAFVPWGIHNDYTTARIYPSPYKDGYIITTKNGNIYERQFHYVKLDTNGTIIDTLTLPENGSFFSFFNAGSVPYNNYYYNTTDDSFRVFNTVYSNNWDYKYSVATYDKNFNITSTYFDKIPGFNVRAGFNYKYIYQADKLDDGTIIGVMLFDSTWHVGNYWSSVARIFAISKEGKFLWLSNQIGDYHDKDYGTFYYDDITHDKHGNIYYARIVDDIPNTPNYYIVYNIIKLSKDGKVLTQMNDTLMSPIQNRLFYCDNNDNLILTYQDGINATIITRSYNFSENSIPTIRSQSNAALNYYGNSIVDQGSLIYIYYNENTAKFMMVKIDTIPIYKYGIVRGAVFGENNNNCVKETNEPAYSNSILKAIGNGEIIYATSEEDGKYFFKLDSGQYSLTIYPNPDRPYWGAEACAQQRILDVNNLDTLIEDFGITKKNQCFYNTVNISVNFLHRCAVPGSHPGAFNVYRVAYCNNGTASSFNTYVDITFDSKLKVDSSSFSYNILPDNVYRFNIGTLNELECGSFWIVATPECDSTVLGQTLCVEAHIYPDTICGVPSYTGPIVTVSAKCLGDSVRFQLQNIGAGNMPSPKHYIVIEDNVLRINRSYQLNANQTYIETLGADSGSTYRIRVEEPDELPRIYGDAYATAAIENCSPQPNFQTGFITQFPNYDGEPFRAVTCNTITGSYDPNKKTASPEGYGPQHYIEANTQIDYQVNFQNTGNDTAFTVVVVDTISPVLDINSIQLEVASHPYQFQRTDSNVIQFVFDSINLVDSFRNEALSHGFVKFKIQQKPNNSDGTKINNKAEIYFDFNTPITTNATYHTIGRDFIQVDLITETTNTKFNVRSVKVFPNPFRDKTQIIIESDKLKSAELVLMNIDGKIIKSITSTTNTFDIYREDLSSGIYIFKIMQNNETVATGKLIIE